MKLLLIALLCSPVIALAEPLTSRDGFSLAPSPEQACAKVFREVPGWREPLVDSATCRVNTRFGQMTLKIFRPFPNETLEQFCSLSYRGEVTFNGLDLPVLRGGTNAIGLGFTMSVSHTGEGAGVANDQPLVFVDQATGTTYLVNAQFGRVPSIRSVSGTLSFKNQNNPRDNFQFSEKTNCEFEPLSAR